MKILLNDKKTPVTKLVTALLVGVLSILVTRITFIGASSIAMMAIATACFSYAVYYTGIFALIPAVLTFTVVLIFEDPVGAINSISFVLPALVAGFAFRKQYRPVSVIAGISVAHLITKLISYTIITLINEGAFSFVGEFESLSNDLKTIAEYSSEAFVGITGMKIASIDAVVSILKAMMIGVYLSSIVLESCIVYVIIALAFRITKADRDVSVGNVFDIIPSRITAFVYVVCFVIALFSNVSTDNIRYYSMLSQNLLLILTPLMLFSGAYYIFSIKFKVEHSSPFTLILAIVSCLFGAFPILIFYFALSGVKYSFKYRNIKKIEEIKNDQK